MLAQLEALRQAAAHPAPEAEKKQHDRGKYTARERVETLLDPGSFQELDVSRAAIAFAAVIAVA